MFDITGIDQSLRKDLPSPKGFSATASDSGKSSAVKKTDKDDSNLELLKMKKSWDVALGPGKSIPMNAFMLYMSGNSVQIFSILITVMLFFNALKAINGTNQAFERFSSNSEARGIKGLLSDPVLLPKVVFVVSQFAVMGLGVWKLSQMGLLPTTHSDWLAFLQPKSVSEFSAGGMSWS